MNDAAQIGKIVRQLREKQSLTQAELATKIGWKQPAICTLEKGRRKFISTTDLNAIALALHSQPEEFLYANESDNYVSPPSPHLITRISEQVAQLSTYQQERVWNIVAEVVSALSQ